MTTTSAPRPVRLPVRGLLLANAWQTEQGEHGLIAEASDLRITPGRWPETVVLVSEDAAGTRTGFLFDAAWVDGEGDLLWVTYRSQHAHPVILRIFND